MFGGEFLKVGAHQASERRVAFDGNFADFFHQFLVKGESDVHKPIIRETLNMGKVVIGASNTGFVSGCRFSVHNERVPAGFSVCSPENKFLGGGLAGRNFLGFSASWCVWRLVTGYPSL